MSLPRPAANLMMFSRRSEAAAQGVKAFWLSRHGDFRMDANETAQKTPRKLKLSHVLIALLAAVIA
ncbi:MAG: hypothetical protein ACYTEQ_21030, partial [Planctomycetota bacterium]